ncbi:MAG: hypothetical protein N4A40_09955 [Tissierellales bacterium]|jgi:hypothetical protein|nr:hypothetical protein [Tissierellales bacterium]
MKIVKETTTNNTNLFHSQEAETFKQSIQASFENEFDNILDKIFFDLAEQKVRATANLQTSIMEIFEDIQDKKEEVKDDFFNKFFISLFDTKLRFCKRPEYIKNQIKKYLLKSVNLTYTTKVLNKFLNDLEGFLETNKINSLIQKEFHRRNEIELAQKRELKDEEILEMDMIIEEKCGEIKTSNQKNKTITTAEYINEEGKRVVIAKTEMLKTGNVNYKMTISNKRFETTSWNKTKVFLNGLFENVKGFFSNIKPKSLTDEQLNRYSKNINMPLFKDENTEKSLLKVYTGDKLAA